MICPNCSTVFSKGRVCPKCGIDSVLFNKSKRASYRLYNSALAKAKENNISGAIEDLKKSIIFDKTNNRARDLLGLCYYRVGEVADALKHWIISSSYDTDDSRAREYIDDLNENTRMLDKYNDAIRQYNRAMEYMSQGSTDLAVIQLKKALDYNPDFVKALCLYAVCCIEDKNVTLAMDCIDRALEIDSGNALALRYKREIMSMPGFKKLKVKKAEDEVKKTDYAAKGKGRAIYKPGGFDVLIFLAGAVAMAVILVTLVVPGWVESKDNKIKELEAQVTTLKDENENGTSVFAVKYAQLEKDNEELKKENEQYKYNEQHSDAILKIKEAKLLAEQNKHLEAGKLLDSLDYESFDDTLKAQIDEAGSLIYGTAGIAAYNEGAAFLESGNTAEAKADFELSYRISPGGEKAAASLLNLGKIAQNSGDKESAKDYYEKVINNFPDSGLVGEAKQLIEGL